MREPALYLCVYLDGPVHLQQQRQLASPDITGQHQCQQRLHAPAEFCCSNIALMARPAGMYMYTKQQRTSAGLGLSSLAT